MSDLESFFDISKKMASVAQQKRVMFEQYDLNLFYFEGNGVFKASKEFISYIKSIKELSSDTSAVILDENNLPIKINDLESFLLSLVDVHIQANNKLFFQHQKLINENLIESIIK